MDVGHEGRVVRVVGVHPIGHGDEQVLIGGAVAEDREDAVEGEHDVLGAVAVEIAGAGAVGIGEGDRGVERGLEGEVWIDETERGRVQVVGLARGEQDRPGGEDLRVAVLEAVGDGHQEVLPAIAVEIDRPGEVEIGVLIAGPGGTQGVERKARKAPAGVDVEPEDVVAEAGGDGVGEAVAAGVEEEDATAGAREREAGLGRSKAPVLQAAEREIARGGRGVRAAVADHEIDLLVAVEIERVKLGVAAVAGEAIDRRAAGLEAGGRRVARGPPHVRLPDRVAGVAVQHLAVVVALDEIGDAVAVEIGEVHGRAFAGERGRPGVVPERKGAGDAGVEDLEGAAVPGEQHLPVVAGVVDVVEQDVRAAVLIVVEAVPTSGWRCAGSAGTEGLATIGHSSEKPSVAGAKKAGEALGPRLRATSQRVIGLCGVLSAGSVSGETRSSRPSPSTSRSIGLPSCDVGAGISVGIFSKPSSPLLYWKRVGGLHTPSAAHSSTCSRSVRRVIGPRP
jgi:hypothetical protein